MTKTESTCLTCGFEGLRVPGSFVAGKGYLVDHPGRIWPCREWFDTTAGLGSVPLPPDSRFSIDAQISFRGRGG